MYSVSIDDSRVVIRCGLINEKKMKLISAIYDTGARYTCFRANMISNALDEEAFQNADVKYLGGFIEGNPSKFYKFKIDRFTFGNIDIGSQTVWITFDENVTMNVVGYDVIKQINRRSFAGSQFENFFQSVNEMKDFVDKHV